MRGLSFSVISLLVLGFVFSCQKKNTPGPSQPATIGSLQLKQQSGTDCNLADTLARMDCAQVALQWPTIEQGSAPLKKSVENWAAAYLNGILMPGLEGPASGSTSVEAAAKAFFDEHRQMEKSVTKGGWTAESKFEVLLNDGNYLTLEITGYSYQGGAHGLASAAVATFDTRTGKQLGWDDLVTNKAALQALAEKTFRETRADLFQPADGSEPYAFGETNPFALPQNYGLVPAGIYCHYIPYEVGPYAIGATQMTIPFGALGNLAKIKPATPVQAPPVVADASNSPKFDFPYFGRYDLGEWKKMPARIEAGGDVGIETAVYEKDGITLEIDTSDKGEYGYAIRHKLLDSRGGVLKTRVLEFSNDPYAVTETVNDYTLSPAKKYTRREVLNKHYSQLNPLPAAAAGGSWREGRADKKPASSGKSAKPVDDTKPASKPRTVSKPSRIPAPPTVTLKQNGDIRLNGKAVGGLETLRKELQAQLLTYAAVPEKVHFKTVGQTGMGMRSEINSIINESIAGAKWVRKKNAIAALNAAVGKKLAMATQLEPSIYKTSGAFAYISARPKRADGAAIDYRWTDYAQDYTTAWFSDNAIGLLQYDKGAWKVLAYSIGVRQAPVDTWVKKYKAPRGLFGK